MLTKSNEKSPPVFFYIFVGDNVCLCWELISTSNVNDYLWLQCKKMVVMRDKKHTRELGKILEYENFVKKYYININLLLFTTSILRLNAMFNPRTWKYFFSGTYASLSSFPNHVLYFICITTYLQSVQPRYLKMQDLLVILQYVCLFNALINPSLIYAFIVLCFFIDYCY